MSNWRSKGGVKKDKTDTLFSELVRERADWICECCGKDFKEDHHGLHCSHIFGRARQGVRVHPLNAVAHCAGCHERLAQHPIEFSEWAKSKLGQAKYDTLQFKANKATKLYASDKEIIHQHYLKERKRLKAARMDGVVGRIEFTLPDVA